ncbi:hypothetical protein EVAR_92187_1 [Eumeta japonica]|uniref:DUF4371 domain-containing protein n=1 Tax=Eumeta variegata TaxID=151549 RepID=A0A4C2A6N2_EUMVA|nr:hypothetical protein EVAR_92187_1 [Eumeta japonica]
MSAFRMATVYGYDIIDMSGRDRDIGRKWESGSAKRKRKAERTASNQALSLNMMKFLNQTASGSTVPSESIASTSTQQTSEIPLGNAPDALSTESELQLDELGSCSSQSKWTLKFLCCHQVIKKNRFCDTSTGTIVEHFMGFLAVTKTTGEYLANAILEHLEKYDLNIQDCGGQGYDNGANMVATEQGLAKYVLPTSNLGLAPPLIVTHNPIRRSYQSGHVVPRKSDESAHGAVSLAILTFAAALFLPPLLISWKHRGARAGEAVQGRVIIAQVGGRVHGQTEKWNGFCTLYVYTGAGRASLGFKLLLAMKHHAGLFIAGLQNSSAVVSNSMTNFADGRPSTAVNNKTSMLCTV